jgi:hypothetical protein
MTASVSASVVSASQTILSSSITNFSSVQTFSSSFNSPVSRSFDTTTINVTTSSIVSIITSSFDFYTSQSFSQSVSTTLYEVYSSSVSGALTTEFTTSILYFTTQSFTQSFTSSYDTYLILNSVDSGEAGNDMYFWDTDDITISESLSDCAQTVLNDDNQSGNQAIFNGSSEGVWTEAEEAALLAGFTSQSIIHNLVYLEGGSGAGRKYKFDLLINKLSEISSSCGFSFNADPYIINFTASVQGVAGNDYYFQSGSTTASFGGASESASIQQLTDDVDNNQYYYTTGSSLSGSVSNLSQKINDILSFISSSASSSVINVSSTTADISNNNIGIQSGSFQVKLAGSLVTSQISSSVSQSFKYQSSDLKLDVTKIANSWLSGLQNEGIILFHSEEDSDVHFGALNFFSQNTNTIYIPRLAVKYDDSVISSSLNVLDLNTQNTVTIRNLNKVYRSGEFVRLNVLAREKYPQKTFNNQFNRFLDTSILPDNSYYAIQDAESEEFIIDFDSKYTKISADNNGSYFMLDMSGFPQERFYRIFIKTTQNDIEQIFEDNKVFKVSI